MTTQSQTDYRAWQAYVDGVVAACEAAGRSYGVVRSCDMPDAFRAGVLPEDFAAAQIMRTDQAIADLAALHADPKARALWLGQSFARRLDADAALGFTRD